MDPLTALSLATNVATFVDFACKLVSGSYAIYNSASGLSSSNASLEAIAGDLSRLTSKFTVKDGVGSKDLQDLAVRCKKVADELSLALEGLKAREPGKRWSSFQAALKEVWKGRRVKELQEQLERLQSAVQLQLSVDIWSVVLANRHSNPGG